MNSRKTYPFFVLMAVIVFVTSILMSCGSKSASGDAEGANEVDTLARHTLQGVWLNDDVGSIVFEIAGDSIFYNDSICAPAEFFVRNDTLHVKGHPSVSYAIKELSSTRFVFVNADGEEVSLSKAEEIDDLAFGEYKGAVNINQGKKIKRDSVMHYDNKRYHAYSQVNPTTYKVYKQSVNSDGLSVETVYYDNIVHICVYNDRGKLFGRDMKKKDFAGVVPQNYLSQAVLSEILIDGISAEGVRYVAILAIPDSNTNFRVNILVTPEGEMTIKNNEKI